MNILSKNASAEDSIFNMQIALEEVSPNLIFSKQIHSLTNCYSVNLKSKDAPNHLYTNGKGTNELSCKASALGEYIERLQTNNFFIEFYTKDKEFYPDQKSFNSINECLNEKLKSFYNPNDDLTLEDFIDFNTDEKDKIIALPFVNQSNNKKVYIPTNIIHNLYVSNGLATGNTPTETKVQALSEIYERYVKIQIIKNAYSVPLIPNNIVKSFSKLSEDIDTLEDLGYKIKVHDASLDGKYPVVAISLVDTKSNALFVSFGCHPIFEVALERTMTELMQGRGVEDLNKFEKPSFNNDIINDSFNIESHFINSDGKMNLSFLNTNTTFKYATWKYDGKNSDDEYEYLVSITNNLQKDIYLREYNYLGFYSCQIIIPSISEIYPIDDLVYNNANIGKEIRQSILEFKDIDVEDILEVVEHLSDDLDVEKYIGVLFEKNFTLGDFKAQIYLMQNDLDSAVSYFETSKQPLSYILAQLCYIAINELDFQEYYQGLSDLFGDEDLQKAMDIFSMEEYFINTTYHQDYINILNLYDRLDMKKKNITV